MVVQVTRSIPLAAGRQIIEACHLSGQDVGRGADMARAADGQDREAQQLDAGVHEEVAAAQVDHAIDVFEVFVGLFHADNVAAISGQPRDGLRFQIHRGAAGDIVDEIWTIPRVGDAAEVAVQSFLGWAGVVRDDDQGRIGPDALGKLREPQAFRVIGGTGSGDQGHAPPHRPHGELDEVLSFLQSQRTGLTGRPGDDHPVAATVDLPFDEIDKAGVVELALAERRDDGHEGAAHGAHGLGPVRRAASVRMCSANRSLRTSICTCVPSPIFSRELCASTAQTIRRPSICTSRAPAVTRSPTPVAARCVTLTLEPTASSSGSRYGRMILRHASSMWRTIDQVEYRGCTGPSSSNVASMSGVTVIVTDASAPGWSPAFTLYCVRAPAGGSSPSGEPHTHAAPR